jgi:hypothetical protein
MVTWPAGGAIIYGMAKQRKPNTGKGSGDQSGKKARGPVLFVQLTEEENGYLLAFIRAQTVEPDRSAVGKTALKKFLQALGYWPADR